MKKNAERNKKIVELFGEGLSRRQIAHTMGLTEGQVGGTLRQFKIKRLGPSNATMKIEGNLATFYQVTDDRTFTVEDLLEKANINLDDWIITKQVIKAQEVFSKKEDVDLKWTGGQISGRKRIYPKHLISTLWHVHAYMARKEPIAMKPVIQPAVVKVRRAKKTNRSVHENKIALALFDPHFGFEKSLRDGSLTPFQDRKALDVALQIAQTVKPDLTAFGGDWLDLADWSDKFLRSPNMYWTTQPAVLEAAWWMGQFMSYSQDGVMFKGNHEKRMDTAIIKHLKESYGLRPADQMDSYPVLSVPNLLGLQSMGVEWIDQYPEGEKWLNETLALKHGDSVSAKPGGTVGNEVSKRTYSVGFGHIHRQELATKSIRRGGHWSAIKAFSPGCLCHVDGRLPGATQHHNWQQGLAIIHYDSLYWNHVELIPIENGRAFYNGEFFYARERLDEIVEATQWERLK